MTVYGSKSLATNVLEDPIAQVSSDNGGRYEVHLSCSTDVWLKVRKTGFATVEEACEIGSQAIITRSFALREAPTHIAGRVFEKDGGPIAHALIGIKLSGRRFEGNTPFVSDRLERADAAGVFFIDELLQEKYEISALTSGHLTETKTVDLGTQPSGRVNFYLFPAAEVAINVRSKSGKGVPFARVIARRGPSSSSCVANEKGVVSLRLPLDYSAFECIFSARGYRRKTVTLDRTLPQTDVVLDDADTFKGRVVSESGMPLIGARVLVISNGGYEPPLQTDGLGMFTATVATPPVRRISASKQGYIKEEVHLQTDGHRDFIELKLKPAAGGIFGRVVDENGRPASRFSLGLWIDNERIYEGSFNDEDGLFAVTDIRAGLYKMIVRTPSKSQTWESNRIEIPKEMFFGEILVQLERR